MSYFDSLSSWQNASNSISQQQQQNEQEQRDKKASSIGDKFEYIDKMLNESGGAVMGFGGGFHIARKVYKKAKTIQAKAQQAKAELEKAKAELENKTGTSTKPETDTNSTSPASNSNQPNGTEDTPASTEPSTAEPITTEPAPAPADAPAATPADAPAPAAADAPAPAPAAGSDSDLVAQHAAADVNIEKNQNIVDEVASKTNPVYDEADGRVAQAQIDAQKQFKKDNPLPDDAPSTEPEFPEAPEIPDRPSNQTKNAPDKPTTDKPPTEPEPDAPKELGPEPDVLPKAGSSGLNDGVSQMESNDGSLRIGQQPNNAESVIKEPSTTASTEGASSEITTSAADETGNIVAGSFNKVKGVVSDVKSGISDLKDQAGNFIKTGVEKVAGQAGKDALETASGVLDFLGPIGELLGAGVALGSFFHDMFDHKKEENKQNQAQNATTGNISQGGGISTTSLQTANVKSNVVGTLV